MKKNQMQILQVGNRVPEVKNLLDDHNSRMKTIETTQSEGEEKISLKVKRASDHVRHFHNFQHTGKLRPRWRGVR